MRFWDSSAIVPLLVAESATRSITAEYERDPEMLVWWATEVECVSALARLERDGALTDIALAAATDRLATASAAWLEIQPVDKVRQVAMRLLRVHALRAADAFQLAAAIVASEDDPRSLAFVTLDDRLAAAAVREGFRLVDVS